MHCHLNQENISHCTCRLAINTVTEKWTEDRMTDKATIKKIKLKVKESEREWKEGREGGKETHNKDWCAYARKE